MRKYHVVRRGKFVVYYDCPSCPSGIAQHRFVSWTNAYQFFRRSVNYGVYDFVYLRYDDGEYFSRFIVRLINDAWVWGEVFA